MNPGLLVLVISQPLWLRSSTKVPPAQLTSPCPTLDQDTTTSLAEVPVLIDPSVMAWASAAAPSRADWGADSHEVTRAPEVPEPGPRHNSPHVRPLVFA